MDDDIMAEDSAHAPPTRPTTEPPSTGLCMLLKTALGDASNQDRSGAVKVPAGLINVLLDMLLNTEKTMRRLEETIHRLNASVDASHHQPHPCPPRRAGEETRWASASCVKA
ncbi:hypothetical protein VP01_506g6 [Puccinia sorghi]|uniref:Uncharacterized protein n=1 Tax=Puccinia sorghi TaxID=27349 RepID=A0A0L6ULF9_9BASI|nr:hypothetical protein VP01_506g6 [Puccinia sorghi]